MKILLMHLDKKESYQDHTLAYGKKGEKCSIAEQL